MFNFRFQKLSVYLSRRKSGILPASGRNFCKMVGHRHHKAQFKKSVKFHDNDQDPVGFRTNCKKSFKPSDIFHIMLIMTICRKNKTKQKSFTATDKYRLPSLLSLDLKKLRLP